MVFELLKNVASWVIPPLDAHPDAQYYWRVRVGLVACSAFGGVVLVTLLAFGVLSSATGFSGFAKAAELQGVVGEIRKARIANLDSQLLELRIKHCMAKNEEGRQIYWAKISAGMYEYQVLSGRVWTLPACSDL